MPPEQKLIAVVNAGSATLKCSLLEGGETVLHALIERLGTTQGDGSWAASRDERGTQLFEDSIQAQDHGRALVWLLEWLRREKPQLRPAAVGHRVVHGGDRLLKPVQVTAEVIGQIEALIPLAPLHQPHNK